MTTRFELFTLNYPKFQPTMGVPVQASNGKPRYALKYQLTHAAPEIYPPRRLVFGANLSHADFEAAYRLHLDTMGVEKLASTFRAISVAAMDHRLVLLCYEDIAKSPDNWCHRTMFARWWRDETGAAVRELGPGPAGTEPTLFD